MNENQFQRVFLTKMASTYPERVYAPHLDLKYEIGKFRKGKSFGMPDTILDVVEFDEDKNFHLWELKLLNSPELWSGKFFGQMMLYNFLFSTEPWSELCGRFSFSGMKSEFRGDVGKILLHLASFGKGQVAKKKDPHASFKSWNVCICGGDGYELAAGYNPVAWSFWIIAEQYFREIVPPLRIWHLFSAEGEFVLTEMKKLNVGKPRSLHPAALKAYRLKELDNQ
jgi:hypothetical protein